MIIKLILSAALVGIGLYALSQRRTTRLFHGLMVLLVVAGGYFVWFPDHTTRIANALGVGRGADLLLYCWVVISLLLIVSLHLRLRRHLELITDLARRMALDASDEPDRPDSHHAGEAGET